MLYGSEICKYLNRVFKYNNFLQGKVHSCFNRVCNFEFESYPLMSIVIGNRPFKPMSAYIDTRIESLFSNFQIEREDKVIIKNNSFIIENRGFIISMEHAKIHDFNIKITEKAKEVSNIKDSILKLESSLIKGNPKGLLPLLNNVWDYFGKNIEVRFKNNIYSEFLKKHVNGFLDAILKNDMHETSLCVDKIIGCGPGLTPSSDDMLLGFIIGLYYYKKFNPNFNFDVAKLGRIILKSSYEKTTRISYEILRFGTKGIVIEDLHILAKSIFFITGSKIEEKANLLLTYGETSGTDIILGLYIGCLVSLLNYTAKDLSTCPIF